jgi:probable rRNA maturation factor
MTHIVNLQNDKNYPIDLSLLERAAYTTLNSLALDDSELTVVVTGDEEIQEMNRNYLNVDKPTDVLSFPFDEEDLPEEFDDAEAEYLGDVVIAYPYTVANAQRDGYSVEDSLCLMVVHGILHLIGYEHDDPEDRQEMWEVQAKILKSLGISPAIADASEND